MSICTRNIFLKKNFVYPHTLKADISKSTRDQRSASGKLTFASFSLLSPLVFGSFLHNWFTANQPNLLFAYKAQLDDGEEEPTSIINMSRDEDAIEGSHEESLIVRP